VPRLGIAGRDEATDIIYGIVLMQKFERTMEMVMRCAPPSSVSTRIGSLPPGVTIEPFYDRGDLCAITVNTVLHNMLFGIALIFLIQWLFSATCAAPSSFRRPFRVRCAWPSSSTVMRGNRPICCRSVQSIFGIIVDSRLIMLENIFRHLAHHDSAPGRKRLNDSLADRLRKIFDGAVRG